MQLNVAHASLREWKECKDTKLEEEEEDQDVMRKITVIEFVKQTKKKEKLESGKSGEKNHNKGKNVGRDKILEHQPEYSPPQQHSPLTYCYWSCIRLSIWKLSHWHLI